MDRLIEDERDRKRLLEFIKHQKMPFVCKVTAGRARSIEQNKLQHLWMFEIAQQWEGHTADQVRGYCKLTFGIPIRCEDDEFRMAYEQDLRPLTYEHQLRLMMHPHDYPVTRDMNTKQMTQYLDAINRHFAEQGMELTQPDEQGLSNVAA